MRLLFPSSPRLAILGLVVAGLTAGVGGAACSSSSQKGGLGEGGGPDASVAGEVDDGGVESGARAESGVDMDGGGGSADVLVYPDALTYLGPDGCFLLGASCLDDSTCCSAHCVDGGCTRLPVQQ